MFFGLSAIQCFVAIIVIFIVIYWLTPRKSAWFPILVVTVLLAVLAFNFQPNETDDLTRYYSQINYLREYGYDYLQKCFDEGINDWNVYRVCGYYFYFISKLPSNSYLPAITIFISYGLMFLVLYKVANKFNASKGNLFLSLMFFLSTYWYYDIASGIRNGLVFSVIFTCAYYMLFERKHILLCLVGCMLSCFMHSAGVILIGLLIITYLTINMNSKFLNIILVFGLAAGGWFMDYLSGITSNEYIQSIAGKAEHYVSGASLNVGTMFIVNVVTYVIVAVVMLYSIRFIKQSKYSEEFKNFNKFNTYIMCFMIGSIFTSLIFVRLSRWILPVLGGMYYMIGMQLQSGQMVSTESKNELAEKSSKLVMQGRLRGLMIVIFFTYTCIHFFYLCTGSSLNWMSF